MQIERLFLAGALSVLCANLALAQPGKRVPTMPPPPAPSHEEPIDAIEVVLESRCPRAAEGTLVLDDEDQTELPVELKNGQGIWNAQLLLEKDPAVFYATVWFPTGRTDCRKVAKVARGRTDPTRHIAFFRFPTCITGSVHSVNIRSTLAPRARQPIRVRYSRDLAPLDDKGTPCRGHGDFESDPLHDHDVNALAINDETFQVSLADVPTPLLVFSAKLPNPLLKASPKHPGGVVFDNNVQQHAKHSGDGLRRNDLARALEAQLVRTGRRDTQDPNAHENNEKRLQKAGLETLILTVK